MKTTLALYSILALLLIAAYPHAHAAWLEFASTWQRWQVEDVGILMGLGAGTLWLTVLVGHWMVCELPYNRGRHE